MKKTIFLMFTCVSILMSGINFAAAEEQLSTAISVGAVPLEKLDTDAILQKREDVVGKGKRKLADSMDTLRCYQRGIRIVNEDLAENVASYIPEAGIAATADTGEHIAVIALGDSLCLIHSKNKQIQRSQQTGLSIVPDGKKKP